MKLITFATTKEAGATLAHLNACTITPDLYQFSQGYLLITGMGVLNALQSVLTTLHQIAVKEVWNLGICGSFDASLQIGSLFQISCVGKHLYLPDTIDPLSKTIGQNLIPSIPLLGEKKLLSVDFPMHCQKQRELLQKEWDLVDMEGYGVALAAHSMKKKVKIWKVISDFAKEGGRALIEQHLESLSKNFQILFTKT